MKPHYRLHADGRIERVMPKPSYPQTPKTATQWFRDHGIVIKEWAAEIGVSRFAVFDILSGRGKARRGISYRAAVVLGLKPDRSAS